MATLKERYRKEIIPALMKRFGYKNVMQVPKLEKIVINVGLGEAIQNIKILDTSSKELADITGQRPVITKARKSIAQFKVRTGMPIGCMVTLRKDRMYYFLDRLINDLDDLLRGQRLGQVRLEDLNLFAFLFDQIHPSAYLELFEGLFPFSDHSLDHPLDRFIVEGFSEFNFFILHARSDHANGRKA